MRKLLDVEREGGRGEFIIYTANNDPLFLCLVFYTYKLIHNKSIFYFFKKNSLNESFSTKYKLNIECIVLV